MNAVMTKQGRSPASTIRVLLANDHQIILWGLEQLINGEAPHMQVVAKAVSTAEALSLTQKHQPDVVLLELQLGGESGVEIIPELLRHTGGRVLILSVVDDRELLNCAVLNGAYGIIRKEDPPDTILKAIERVHEGERWLDRVATGQLFMSLAGNSHKATPDPEAQKLATLTSKELEIIAALVSHPGASTRELAELLHVSEHTMRNHLSQIYSKLDVANRLELFAYASHWPAG